jgi:hypothetical protein
VYAGDDASAELSGDTLNLLDASEPVVTLESDPGQLRVFDTAGEAVRVGLDDEGAGEMIISSQGKQIVSLEATSDGGEVDVYGQSGAKVVAALRSKGGSGLVAVADSSGLVASEMSLSNGQGQVVVWGPGAKAPAAIMTRTATGGAVQVLNDKFNVGNLVVGPRGGGQLQLHDPSGANMVEAGSGVNGKGIVRVGPSLQCAGTKMGLANPDCLIGRLDE